MSRNLGVTAVLLVLLVSTACRSAYYGAWEKFGKDKRDLLKEISSTT